jgi:hypothetical protein
MERALDSSRFTDRARSNDLEYLSSLGVVAIHIPFGESKAVERSKSGDFLRGTRVEGERLFT